MNLTSPSQVKAWCIERDFHPNRTLGQNFLVDRNILESIVDAGLEFAEPGEMVLEVGPGLGVLTEELLRRGHGVVAIEKDPILAGTLEERIGDAAKSAGVQLRVIKGDALEVLARQPSDSDQRPAIMVSNLPYQAGTRILLDIALKREMRAMTVLLQTEVAERLAAAEGSRDRSLSGVLAQLDYDVSVVRHVAASCFWPRPEIGSSVARLVRHDRNAALSPDERAKFVSLAKMAFSHRRKQLASIFKGFTSSKARAETLSIADWIDFTKSFIEKERNGAT